jgi:hypothetical protein
MFNFYIESTGMRRYGDDNTIGYIVGQSWVAYAEFAFSMVPALYFDKSRTSEAGEVNEMREGCYPWHQLQPWKHKLANVSCSEEEYAVKKEEILMMDWKKVEVPDCLRFKLLDGSIDVMPAGDFQDVFHVSSQFYAREEG